MQHGKKLYRPFHWEFAVKEHHPCKPIHKILKTVERPFTPVTCFSGFFFGVDGSAKLGRYQAKPGIGMGEHQHPGPTIDDWSSVFTATSTSGLTGLASVGTGSFIFGDSLLTSSVV
ncbi:hypothetical protein F2P56_028656 [Juglans regia]|uniref:Uncharacterized protein n=1 Tax=Juglans regia TaxID=51240 RepID=A0A833WXL4_JUGRE|nr:hypothetical protein F2P56_028656 [Juglans regia]